jgi:hypothetical protein
MEIKKIYTGKDKRTRVTCKDNEGNLHVISYPRLIMEQHLGRKLKPNEDVHHIDGDVTNNDISNLQVLDHVEHEKLHNPAKYYDKEVICDVCGKTFIWTAERQSLYQRDFNRNKNRIITCSKSCSSLYGRYIQLGYDKYKALELSKNRKR